MAINASKLKTVYSSTQILNKCVFLWQQPDKKL